MGGQQVSKRKTPGLYEYLMSVADTLANTYHVYGMADTIRNLARPYMGLDPSIIELLNSPVPGEDDEEATARRMATARAVDAARDAIREAEAEGQPRTTVFLRAARAAAAIVGDNEGGIIAARLLGLLPGDQGEGAK